jgi:hypothetical protein
MCTPAKNGASRADREIPRCARSDGAVRVVTSCKTLEREGGTPSRFFVSVDSGGVEVEWNQQLWKC